MEVEESGLGEERVADKPLGASQPTREDPPRHNSAQSTPTSPVLFLLLAPVTYLMNS